MSPTLTELLPGSTPSLRAAHEPSVVLGGSEDVLATVARLAAEASGTCAADMLERVRAHQSSRLTSRSPELEQPGCQPPPAGALLDAHGLPSFEHRVGRGPDPMGSHRPARALVRNQRRVLRSRSERELDGIAKRLVKAPSANSTGVWSREVFRRIRAGVQDASGRAAECLLYMLGTHEAAALAEKLDARVPMDRRIIAFFYALATAPSNNYFAKLKLGLPLGLFSGALADPNNANLAKHRKFCPSRRTLCSDLARLEAIVGLRRWQIPVELAEPCEMKRDAKHPTNRYWVPSARDGMSMMLVATALGDIVPSETVDADAAMTEEDRAALAEAVALWCAEGDQPPSASG